MSSASQYQPGREIARGGMGAVLETRDNKLSRTVAMKVMLRRQASEDEKQRFLQEARVLGQLAHPNIVPIHDVGRDSRGCIFYTMKLVQGGTLNDVLRKLKLSDSTTLTEYPLSTLLTIFQKVCDAIGFAHSRGIIHRDLKPENIMVGEFGEVLVMDWGLAKFLSESAAQEAAATVLPELSGATVVVPEELPTVASASPSATCPDIATEVDDASNSGDEAPAVTGDIATVLDEPEAETRLAAGATNDLATVAEGSAAESGAIVGDGDFSGIHDSAPTEMTGSSMTIEGAVMGTPNYMSPEQAAGKIAELDARSDIFSLGGVLYAILTLRPPVVGNSLEEVLSKVRSGTIMAPTGFNALNLMEKATAAAARTTGSVEAPERMERLPHCPGEKVPARLSVVAMKALRRERSERYQSVAEFSEDITAYQGGFATTAEEASVLTLFRLFVNRHKTLAMAFSIGVLMVIGFMAKVISSEKRATRNAMLATENEGKAKVAQGSAEIEKEANRRAFARAETALGEGAIRELDGLAARELLALVSEDLRDANWNYLFSRADTSISTVSSTNPVPVLGVEALSGLPGTFVTADGDGRITLVNALTGKRLLEFSGTFGTNVNSPFALSYSAIADELAVANWEEGKVVFHSPHDGRMLREWVSPKPWFIEFSPNGKQLLFTPEPIAGQRVALRLYDAKSGDVVWTFDPDTDWMQAAFHPSGDFVVVAFNQSDAALLDAKTGREIRRLPNTGPLVYRLAVSPSGEFAAFGDGQGGVTVVALEAGQLVTQFRAGENIIRLLAFTPDNFRLVTLTYPRNQSFYHVRIWDAVSGKRLQNILGVTANSKYAAVHPQSGELIVAGDETKCWQLAQLDPSWVVESGIYPPLIGFWASNDSIVHNDVAGHPQIVQLVNDGSISTNWISSVASGRDANLSIAGGVALIGGATFNLSGHHYFLLEQVDKSFRERAHWESENGFTLLRLSPSGDRLWTGESVLDPATGKELLTFTNLPNELVAGEWVSSNRVIMASMEGDTSILALVDISNDKWLRSVTNQTKIYEIAVAPGKNLFAEGGQDKLVRLRDIETLKIVREIRVHDGAITALAFHPQKPILATASEDLTIRLWSIDSGGLIEELRGPAAAALSLSFSVDGKRLASAGGNGLAFVWEPLSLRAPAPPATPVAVR